MDGPIVLYMPWLPVGGAERALLRLAAGFAARGRETMFLLDRAEGALLDAIPPGVGLESLGAGRSLAAIPKLAGWLRRRRPPVLLSALSHQNVVALWARRLSDAPTRIVVAEHTVLSRQTAETGGWQHRVMPALARRFYPQAAAVVAISAGVAADLAAVTGLPAARIATIHNPVVDDGYAAAPRPGPPDPWLAPGGPPAFVAAGRLVPLKDFPTLFRAFALLRRSRPARLLLLGAGPAMPELDALRHELGIAEDARMVRDVADVHPWFAHAAGLVLTSRYEGFGNVLVEAMSWGTPVASTDCPVGPAEILEGGRLGPLVPIGDAAALAGAMARLLDEPAPAEALRRRADDFTVSRSVERYLALFDQMAG